MFLQPPPASPATERFYQGDRDDQGYVANFSRLWARRPEVFTEFAALRMRLTDASSLSPRDLGVLVCATAASLGDSYCALAWGKRLAEAADPATAAAVLSGAAGAVVTARDRALAVWARKVARDPNSTTRADVDRLRGAGLSEQEIFEATVFVGFRLAFSSVNDALGLRPDRQLAAAVPAQVRDAVTFGRPVAQAESTA